MNNYSLGDYGRRLNIIFALDTTLSMEEADNKGKKRRDYLNDLIKTFIRDMLQDSELASTIFVSYLTFSDGVTMETDFIRPEELEAHHFKNVHPTLRQRVLLEPDSAEDPFGKKSIINFPRFESIGEETISRIGSGVLRAIEKLSEEREKLLQEAEERGSEVKLYAPVLVLITDGAPGNTSNRDEELAAMISVYEHCFSQGNASNIIFPVICGIGTNVQETLLASYSQGYKKGFQCVDEKNPEPGFFELITRIRVSITKSIALSKDTETTSTTQLQKQPENYREPKLVTICLNDDHEDDEDDDDDYIDD